MNKGMLVSAIAGGVVFAGIVIFGYYLGGFDFNQRGKEMVDAYSATLFVGAFGCLIGIGLYCFCE